MSRIVYFVTAPGSRSGGNKMTFRHVEALQSLGYDAVVRRAPHAGLPDWFAHTAAVEDSTAPLGRDDVLVFARGLLQRQCAIDGIDHAPKFDQGTVTSELHHTAMMGCDRRVE